MKKNYLFTLTFSLLFAFTYAQTTYYVATAANGGSDGVGVAGTEAAPFLTLDKALQVATTAGDIINIGPGTFTDRALTVSTNITIQGHGREETVFTNTTAGGFMAIDANVTLKNMTIKNYESSTSAYHHGGALLLGADWGTETTSTPRTITIENIKFFDNEAAGSDAGVGNGGAIAAVQNTSTSGAHSITINECLFYDNKSGRDGGAIYVYQGGDLTVNNSVFTDNYGTRYSGAIYFGDNSSDTTVDPTMTINNSTFYRNYSLLSTSTNTGAIRAYNGGSDVITVNVNNSIVYNNISGSYFGRPDWTNYQNSTLYYLGSDMNDSGGGTINWYLKNTFFKSIGTNYYNTTSYGSGSGMTIVSNTGCSTGWPYIDGGAKLMWPSNTTSGSSYDITSMSISSSSPTSKDVDGVDRPQGSVSEVGAYESRNTWTGAVDAVWTEDGNWSFGTAPDNSSSNNAPIVTSAGTDPIISSDVNLDHLLIRSGTLTIAKTGSLKLTGNLINNSTLNMESDSEHFSSLIVEGESYGLTIYTDAGRYQTSTATFTDNTGNITYKRHVADEGTDEWDFIGSPVEGQDLQSLIDNNSSLATNGSSVAIGPYDNSANNGDSNTSNFYTYYNHSNNTGGSSVTLPVGKGYVMATDEGSTAATVDFTGPVVTENIYYAITNATSANTNYGKFNLVANPYTSFINANSNTGGTNFITVNSDAGNLLSGYVYVYGYDGDGTFTYYNNTSSALRIAPGQGFFVASKAGGASLQFTKAMQTNTGDDDFIENDPVENTEVVIKLFNDDNELDSTKLFFEEGLSLGLDDGYDAGSFNQNSPIMTRLILGDEGLGMAINAMGLDAMENAVIPLVINQLAGQEFRINLHSATIPDPNVYLEDVEEGTFTNLYEEDFVLTPISDLEGVGRFFIHMSADTMSNGEVSTSMLNAYKEVNANYITLEGLATQSNNINVSLYTILGRKVLDTSLSNNMNTQTISTLGMAEGIYVIELESGNDRLTKKLIIQ